MDLIIRNAATLTGSELAVVDIGIEGTNIAAIAPSLQADGRDWMRRVVW
jgi:dihydroorotase-like cyclic amidohydrolase